jgi:hypothetical protein
VPTEYNDLDKRGSIKLSTKIKVANDRTGTKAGRVAARMNATHEAYWRSLAENTATEARQAYDDAIKLARSLGLDYLQPSAGAHKPIHEVLERIETAMVNGRMDILPSAKPSLVACRNRRSGFRRCSPNMKLPNAPNFQKCRPTSSANGPARRSVRSKF